MPLSNADWAELLAHARIRVREAGLSEADERVTLDFQTSQSAKADFRRYLESMISALEEGAVSTYQRALNTFREHVSTEDGTPIAGIEVRVEDRDASIFATHRIDLADQLDRGVAVVELKRLHKDLISSGVFDEQSDT